MNARRRAVGLARCVAVFAAWLVVAGCCATSTSASTAEGEEANQLPPVIGGTAPIQLPHDAFAYLVEAVTPGFVAPPTERPPGRPPRFWHLLAAESRDRLGNFRAFAEAWPAIRSELLTVFAESTQVLTPRPGVPQPGAVASSGETAELEIRTAGGRTLKLSFVRQHDPQRIVNETGAVWRLRLDGIEALFGSLIASN